MLKNPVVKDKETGKTFGCFAPKYGPKKWRLPIMRLEIDQ